MPVQCLYVPTSPSCLCYGMSKLSGAGTHELDTVARRNPRAKSLRCAYIA